MTDRELLELAAKAAGYTFEWGAQPLILAQPTDVKRPWRCWNPLTDDGDALRLAVKLRIDIEHMAMEVFALKRGIVKLEPNDDPYAATRRAIVRAAAEIGKQMAGTVPDEVR